MDEYQRDHIAQLEDQLRESHPESEAVVATLPSAIATLRTRTQVVS
jgi:hypothetical protein